MDHKHAASIMATHGLMLKVAATHLLQRTAQEE